MYLHPQSGVFGPNFLDLPHCPNTLTCISLPIGTNGKPLVVIGKFVSAIGKLMIGKTLATNGEEITNAVIGNDVLANCW